MSGFGYKQKCNIPSGYTRFTPECRLRRGQCPLSRFSSAMPSGAGGQDVGAVRPRLTRSRHSSATHLLDGATISRSLGTSRPYRRKDDDVEVLIRIWISRCDNKAREVHPDDSYAVKL